MKPGHPFETPGLDDVRAEQRRALRLVPDDVFVEYAPAVGPDAAAIPVEDRAFVETAVRAEANTVLDELGSLLAGWREYAQVETMDSFYESNRRRAEDLEVRQQTAFFDQLEVARTAHEAAARPVARVEDAPRLRRLLFLLVWADGLTDYEDPRLGAVAATLRARDDRSITLGDTERAQAKDPTGVLERAH
jgi:hypothetical protein